MFMYGVNLAAGGLYKASPLLSVSVFSTPHLPDSCSHLSRCSLGFTSHFPCAWEDMAVQELG